ncbi:MAG: HAMP domain-containing histidine kinase [Verrucomicrobia bacterium]|nr:HAMP domain-containing histidine kinase [Verrucomicrobiota bacterium]
MNAGHRATILVVEDDEAVRQTVLDILALNDFTAVAATNGLEGLALARRDHPALIVTDIEMPVMSGFEMLEVMRKDEALRAIPVIVITAKSERPAARQGMNLGADDYITKPFTENELVQSIRARLEKKELLDELDAFAHTVAHDLKNPLATLLGRLGLIEMTLEQASPESLRRSVVEASVAASRLGAIIDELLLLAGVRREHAPVQPLDMGALVTEARDRLEDLLRRTECTIEMPAGWPEAVGVGSWVVHVWTNYLSNAAKYAGPKPRISLGAEPRADGRTVRFWVQDRGPGLDLATQARLFVPFTRITSVRARGHGLGLSIVRRIVEKLGGTVGVESQPGAGSRFWFELPASTTASPP